MSISTPKSLSIGPKGISNPNKFLSKNIMPFIIKILIPNIIYDQKDQIMKVQLYQNGLNVVLKCEVIFRVCWIYCAMSFLVCYLFFM